VIQRKERGPAKWQLAAYNHVHNKRWLKGLAYKHWQPTTVYFRLGPLALAVWNNIKPILLAKEDELGD